VEAHFGVKRISRSTVVTVLVAVLAAGCTVSGPPTAGPTVSEKRTPLPSSVPTATEIEQLERTFAVDCETPDGDFEGVEVALPDEGMRLDLASMWASNYQYCDYYEGSVAPLTSFEMAAYEASGYAGDGSEPDVGVLYTICFAVGPDDHYVQPETILSKGQVKELRAVITLCPHHPLMGKWEATLARSTGEGRKNALAEEVVERPWERYGELHSYADALDEKDYWLAYETLVCPNARDNATLDEQGGLRGIVLDDSTSPNAEPSALGVWTAHRTIETACPEYLGKFVGMLDQWDSSH
jgi:hypothetical protein